ncbi:MAG: DUF4381 domain-containing protein [Rhodanobacteraceae bacterium]
MLASATIAWLRWRRPELRPWAEASREIDELQAKYARDGDAASLAAGASRLLRRVALRIDPRAAAKAGEAWRSFLRSRAANKGEVESLDALIVAPFRSHPEFDAEALLVVLRAWCRRALCRRHGFRSGRVFHRRPSSPCWSTSSLGGAHRGEEASTDSASNAESRGSRSR